MKWPVATYFAISIIVTSAPSLCASGVISYVVLEDGEPGALVRMSADLGTVTTIARGVSGSGLTVDGAGNYIVAGRTALLRITPSGAISTIAVVPDGSEWASVAVDGAGNFLVGDGRKAALWRVSADGKTTTKLLTFDDIDVDAGSRKSAFVVDRAGDCFFIVQSYNHKIGIIPQLFRIDPLGETKEIKLSGVRFRMPNGMSTLPNGDLLVSVYAEPQLLRITRDGMATVFADLDQRDMHFPGGLALKPDDGSIVILLPVRNEVAHLKADGSPTTEARVHLPLTPMGILAELGR